MNFIDSIRIRINPNIIDTFSVEKIDAKTVTYAIRHGYSFNSDTLEKFISFNNYRSRFRNEGEVFEYLKSKLVSGAEDFKLEDFFILYNSNSNDRCIEMIKDDDDLSAFMIEQLEKCMTSYYLKIEDVIQIIDGKEGLIDEALQKVDLLRKSIEFSEFAEYIAKVKTPQELADIQIRDSKIDEAFITSGSPENIMQLFGIFNKDDFSKFSDLLQKAVEENIEQYIPYLDRLDEVFSLQTKQSFITQEMKTKTMNYLKANNILYSEEVPKFALSDNDYIVQCLLQDPTNILKMPRKFVLGNYPEEARKIADKIKDEQIKFEGEIPEDYLFQRAIFENIVSVNPELLNMRINLGSLNVFTKGMQDEEVIDYYKKLGVPFNRETVRENNFLSVLECFRNDYMTLEDTKKEFTEDEYKKIYEELKGKIKPEEILQSRFLTQNPYFVKDILRSGLDLSSVNFQATRYYEKFYLELKFIAIENGVSIPEPKKYDDIIRFTKEDEIYIHLDSTESIEKGLEYLAKMRGKTRFACNARPRKI